MPNANVPENLLSEFPTTTCEPNRRHGLFLVYFAAGLNSMFKWCVSAASLMSTFFMSHIFQMFLVSFMVRVFAPVTWKY